MQFSFLESLITPLPRHVCNNQRSTSIPEYTQEKVHDTYNRRKIKHKDPNPNKSSRYTTLPEIVNQASKHASRRDN